MWFGFHFLLNLLILEPDFTLWFDNFMGCYDFDLLQSIFFLFGALYCHFGIMTSFCFAFI